MACATPEMVLMVLFTDDIRTFDMDITNSVMGGPEYTGPDSRPSDLPRPADTG